MGVNCDNGADPRFFGTALTANSFTADLVLFTDGSVNPLSRTGYGAYIAVPDKDLSLDVLKSCVKVKRFDQTSSTKLELQTLIWALVDSAALGCTVSVYTDSQNIMGLLGRRDQLEKKAYQSKKNLRIKNFELYREFYHIMDQMDCEFVKIQGHKPFKHKNEMEKIFSLVDKASRHALRKERL